MNRPVNVEIRRADEAARPVVFNLLQIYLHTFAALAPPESPDGRFNHFGQFDYPHFNSYWTGKNRHPYLIYADTHLAGFALVNDHAASGRRTDFALAEFFISGKYQRHGIGKKAALDIFAHHPGQWELAIAAGNAPALAFWEKILPKTAEKLSGEKNSAVFRFKI